MPRLAICSRDLHWHWINRTLLCDTMEVSMLSRAWLTIAQHMFQPALTGRPELISRKIVSGEPRTKAIAVSRFRGKLSPANWVQGVTAISRKISRCWAPKKWGPTCDRDISNSAIYTTAIYRAYTVSLMKLLSDVAVRQQAITWANVDPDLCRQMASLGLNELNNRWLTNLVMFKYRQKVITWHKWSPGYMTPCTLYILSFIEEISVFICILYHYMCCMFYYVFIT